MLATTKNGIMSFKAQQRKCYESRTSLNKAKLADFPKKQINYNNRATYEL